jgi:transcription antitermination factor NusG
MDQHIHQEERSWYAVFTRSRQEKIASLTLAGLGIPHFLPLINEERRWSDRKKVTTVPLFPGYLFVRIPRTAELHLSARKVPGVVDLVGNQSGPLAVPDCELDSVRTVLSCSGECSPHPFLQTGDRVRVVRGVFAGIEGTLIRLGTQSTLVISVGLIQRSASVKIAASDVEPAPPPQMRGPERSSFRFQMEG